jgi:transposase
VWFLPAYPQDLNPIEEAFSKVKTLLKTAAACTKEALVEAIARTLAAVTTEDARGLFSHSGYELRDRSLRASLCRRPGLNKRPTSVT